VVYPPPLLFFFVISSFTLINHFLLSIGCIYNVSTLF
jgi:hypothetical protein